MILLIFYNRLIDHIIIESFCISEKLLVQYDFKCDWPINVFEGDGSKFISFFEGIPVGTGKEFQFNSITRKGTTLSSYNYIMTTRVMKYEVVPTRLPPTELPRSAMYSGVILKNPKYRTRAPSPPLTITTPSPF